MANGDAPITINQEQMRAILALQEQNARLQEQMQQMQQQTAEQPRQERPRYGFDIPVKTGVLPKYTEDTYDLPSFYLQQQRQIDARKAAGLPPEGVLGTAGFLFGMGNNKRTGKKNQSAVEELWGGRF